MWKAESILLSLRGRQAALLVVAQAALVSRPAANAWADDGAALEPGARVAREAEAKAYEDTLQITAQRLTFDQPSSVRRFFVYPAKYQYRKLFAK